MNDDLIESARHRLAQQAADLCNKAGYPPLTVADLLFECASAVALEVVSADALADAFRKRADDLERLDQDKVLDS